MGGCSAPNCSNSTNTGKQLFRFPKDAIRKKKWVVNSRRDFEPTAHSRLCEVGSHSDLRHPHADLQRSAGHPSPYCFSYYASYGLGAFFLLLFFYHHTSRTHVCT